MKRFDQEAILGRVVNNLQSKNNWSKLQADGATYQLLEAIAEPLAELGRYGEYLLQELKWDTCRNFSSAKHMARLVGKKLDRKHSAVGSLVVSHSDLDGVARYSFLGIDNFAIDSESNYDDLKLNSELKHSMYTRALVPWMSNKSYSVPIGATCTTNGGVPFVCAESKSIKACTTKWSEVVTNSESLKAFKAADGWNGYKYISIPVVQGIQKTVSLGNSDGSAGQVFLVATLDIEAADNYYTKQFCYIEVEDLKGEVTTWKEVQHLQLEDAIARSFEIEILDDLSGTAIKFGDSINGAIPSEGSKITLHYLETLGSEGNVEELYSFQNEISGADVPAGTEYNNLTIGCQNMWPILGGRDLETLKEFKANAETAYAKNYDILHTYTELEKAINSISPIPLIKVHTSTFYENSVINSTTVSSSRIGLTGLSTAMQPLNSLEAGLLETILNTELNSKVLSNKYIRYIAPKIVEIDSKISIEPKNSVQSKEDFKVELEDKLMAKFGKANINPVGCYKQADLLREALQLSTNIDSIQSTNLLSVASTDVSFGALGDKADLFFLFKFEVPNLASSVHSFEGFCDKALADGNEIPYIFNICIGNAKYTYVVKEQKTSENLKLLFEKSDFFSETAPIHVYNNSLTDTVKYAIKGLSTSKYTYSKQELQSYSSLIPATSEAFASENDSKGIYFSVTRSANQPVFYLALNAQKVAKDLGFVETVTDSNISKVYNYLLSSIDSSISRLTVSFEPVDKTVSSDWDTIMYYNNIEVVIEDAVS